MLSVFADIPYYYEDISLRQETDICPQIYRVYSKNVQNISLYTC